MIYLKRYWVTISLVAIILASFFLMIFSAQKDSIVIDEQVHISAGYLHTWEGDYTFNAEHPPLLNDLAGFFAKIGKPKLPQKSYRSFTGSEQWDYADLFWYHSGNNVDKIIFWSRLPFIFLTLGLIYLSFLWTKTLFGPKAGLMAAALAAFSPNILAHGRLATTDIGVAFFFLLFFWILRKYLLSPSWIKAIWLGFSLGLVVLAKFSGLLVLPLLLVFLLWRWLIQDKGTWKENWRKRILELILIISVGFVLFWLVYAFSSRSEFISSGFVKLLLFPLGKFWQGYQILSDHNSVGHWAYLNGIVDYHGWWYYFPLVLWYKLTLPIMILFGLAIISFRKNHRNFLEESLLIVPIISFLILAMISKIDIGIRHILPILPFLYIWISRLMMSKNLFLKRIVVILVIGQIVIGFLSFPNYLAYFNQIAGGAKNGIRHLTDSNLDWNQNIKRFSQYAQEKNIKKIYALCWDQDSFRYYGVGNEILPNQPVNGVVAICAQQLMVPPDGFDFSWVTKFPPDDNVGNGIYVWRFDQKPIELR